MANFFARNITRGGRIARAIWGLALIVGAALLWGRVRWAAVLLVIFGLFAFYEAARGWCIMRACGLKTKL